jgi:hypothetical protein
MTDRSRADIERYIRQRTGVTTPGELGRAVETMRRYRDPETGNTDHEVRPLLMEMPPGFQKGDGTLTNLLVSSTGYARYIGRAVPRLQAVRAVYHVTTIAATVTYAEVGLCVSDAPALVAGGADVELTTIGYWDAATQITGTGRKTVILDDFERPNAGVHLWLVITVQATTPPTLRAGVPDFGGFLTSKAGSARPSTMAANAVFAPVLTTVNDLWWVVQQIQA